MSAKASSIGNPTVMIIANDISGSQDPCMIPVLPYLVGPPIKLTGEIFTTGTGLSVSTLSFVNRTTVS